MRPIPTVLAASLLCLGGAVPSADSGQQSDLRARLLAIPIDAQLGGDATRPIASQKSFSLPMPNAPRHIQRPFSFGNRLFNTNWTIAPGSVKAFDGLGPLFNRVSCSGCHTLDGRGQPPPDGEGPFDSMLIRLSVPGADHDGGPKPHPVYGGQLSESAMPGVAPEGVARVSYSEVSGSYGDGERYSLRHPRYEISQLAYGELGPDILMSPRVAPHMVGLGLLEAVPDATLAELADPEDRDGDGISGRINHVWDQRTQAVGFGRFGWKANQPNLFQQSAGAALGDIGLTTSLNPAENCSSYQPACAAAFASKEVDLTDSFLDKLVLYTRSIAVPAQRGGDRQDVKQGEALFRSYGCASCHMPSLVTSGESVDPEFRNQTIHPFTDLLLHDMGVGLADNRPDYEASGSEWRTPPLWGLGLMQTVNGHETLLHDGRARGFAEAILWHGGEGETAKERFRLAPRREREALLAFLRSL